jgi:hypothetical protein
VARLKLPRLLKDLTSVRKSYLRGNFDNCSGLRTDVRSCALSATLVRLLFFTASGVRMSSANSFSLATSFGQHQTVDCPMQPVIPRPPGCHLSTTSAPGPVSSRAMSSWVSRRRAMISTSSRFLRSQQISVLGGENILDRRAMPAKASSPRSEGFDKQATSVPRQSIESAQRLSSWAARLVNNAFPCARIAPS